MTKDQVREALDRVLTWPPERQEDAVRMLMALEAREGELYQPSRDEWLAIEEGLEQARRGDFAAAPDVVALLRSR